jgi:hypothetical protein
MSSVLRRSRPALAALCIALLLPIASTAGSESAGHFAVRVKNAELHRNWQRMWELLHPRQRAFIPRALFVRCMRRVRNPRPRTIRVLSVSRALASIPGVRGPKATVSTVAVRVDYGSTAPSQRVLLREVLVDSTWYWINNAASKRAFVRINFCT